MEALCIKITEPHSRLETQLPNGKGKPNLMQDANLYPGTDSANLLEEGPASKQAPEAGPRRDCSLAASLPELTDSRKVAAFPSVI